MDNIGYNNIKENYGYYFEKVPKNVLDELKIQIEEIQSNFNNGNKANYKLVGEIQHEYIIKPQNQLKHYIKNLTQTIENHSQYIKTYHNENIVLNLESDIWVNFQKKHEYNPVHSHGGAYSWVIWYQIPYKFEDERKYHYTNEETCHHGRFNFVWPIFYNGEWILYNHSMNMGDNNNEGYIAIFPSSLNHCVYPFYSSDDYRITVAGNVRMEV